MQEQLAGAGFDPGPIDGAWGARTAAALARAMATAGRCAPLAWGARVSAEFREKTRSIAARIGVPTGALMTCMAWETGRTFNPAVLNRAGSGAVGLIQFMPATARALGTSSEALARMSAVDQLDYVERYFQQPHLRGRLGNLGDLYMAILWPAGVSQPDSYVLWDRGSRPTTYRQNAGLDANGDGRITRAEATAKVAALLTEGLQPGNVWTPSL